MLAKIYVTLKKGVHDPQGEAVLHSLKHLGFGETENVRVGKYLEVKLKEEDKVKANEHVTQMCEKLLANTVIESYKVELE